MDKAVAPAKAGAQGMRPGPGRGFKSWIPAFAGMTALLGFFAASPSVSETPPAAEPGPVYSFTVTGTIDPAVSRYLISGLDQAARVGASAALVRLDTPGGLLDATRDIVQAFLNAPFPVILYVSPQGARATSAGVFLMMAADVAAMAPQTHLGAAHPVSLGGGAGERVKESTASAKSGSVMEEKAVSDAAAYMRSLAEAKGRNADWAEKAVRESLSLTAEAAFAQEVIDVVAADEADLRAQLADAEVEKNGKVFPLDLGPSVPQEMGWTLRFLHALAHPNIAYLLLMLGFYALIYEFASPGIGFGGVTGVICLVLAFFSLQLLPLNYAGLALLVAGVIMMAVDHALAGHGLLMTGGILCFALGSFLLFDRSEPYFRVSLSLIIGTVGAGAAFSAFILKKAWEIRHLKPLAGKEALEGEIGEVREGGMVFVHGEYWSADSDWPVAPGDKVRVAEVLGNKLRVEKI